MRVILVGPPDERRELRSRIPASITIVGESATMAAGRALGREADAEALVATVSSPLMREVEALPETLTPREVQVLTLMAEGLANKRIAERLEISDQTVKFHVAAVCGKLGAANRTSAVRRAIRRGLIPL